MIKRMRPVLVAVVCAFLSACQSFGHIQFLVPDTQRSQLLEAIGRVPSSAGLTDRREESSVPETINSIDLAAETEQLLKIHASDRRAHFETNAKLLMEHAADDFISVSNGSIQRPTRAESLKFFEQYFKDAKYYEWDDLEPPIVRVSNDASMAWMIVRTRVRRAQTASGGEATERTFVYAGIMAYEKKAGRWVRVANVSTFEPQAPVAPSK